MKKPELPPHSADALFTDGMKLFGDKEMIAKLSEIEIDYPYWEHFKYKASGLEYPPALLWEFVKFQRSRSYTAFELTPDHGSFAFKYNITPKVLQFLHEFDFNLGGTMEGKSIIPQGEKRSYLISSIMEEAIASSKLEGAVSTREAAKEMLRTNRKPKDISERMILNNYQTIQRIVEIKEKRISIETIKEIHRLMTQDTLKNPESEGNFRGNNEVQVTDANDEVFYDPPSHELLDRLMGAFCDFANNEGKNPFIHPIIHGIILHFLIGYIHPFVDGNGRTARAIFYWYLISKGYWLMEYLSISRIIVKSPAQYAKAYLYTEYDENDLTYFIDYNLKAMDLALKSLQKHIDNKIQEKNAIYQFVRNLNVNERQISVLQDFLNNPHISFTIAELQNQFQVVYQTARTDLQGLVKSGYLIEKLIGRKLFFFRSNEFENLLKSNLVI